MNSRPELILASASPRRRELLTVMGLKFRVVPANVEELPGPDEPPDQLALRLSTEKAQQLGFRHPQAFVLGADTVVAVKQSSGSVILGKPRDRDEASQMLALLSGREHQVYTGFCLLCSEQSYFHRSVVCSTVRFSVLSPEFIAAYLDTGESFDKAGAYGIQSKGLSFVSSVEGSYTNVVGLPVPEVLEALVSVGLWSPKDLTADVPELRRGVS